MGRRTYYFCDDCRKTVEITPENGYICDTCNKSLKSDTMDTSTILMRNIPMARSTKMEISYDSIGDSVAKYKSRKGSRSKANFFKKVK